MTNQLADRITLLAYNLVVPTELRRAWTGGGDRVFNKITGVVVSATTERLHKLDEEAYERPALNSGGGDGTRSDARRARGDAPAAAAAAVAKTPESPSGGRSPTGRQAPRQPDQATPTRQL